MKLVLVSFIVFLFVSCGSETVDETLEHLNEVNEQKEEMSTLKKFSVAFYNVENLFDTENDPLTSDDEFTPDGAK